MHSADLRPDLVLPDVRAGVSIKQWVLPVALVVAAFLWTRTPTYGLIGYGDTYVYAGYASEWCAAARHGEWLHEHRHRRHGEKYQPVEYPPLATAFMTLPALLVEDPFEGEYYQGEAPRYFEAFFYVMALVDVVLLLLVFWLVRRLYPAATPAQTCARCLAYVVTSWPLYNLLYTRLDLVVGFLVTAALALLVSRRHWAWAMFALALGINFKLIPALLGPVWVVAALPAASLHGPWRTLTRQVAVRAGVLAAFTAAIFAACYAAQGPGSFEFVGYHRDRGIQVESTWSTLALAFWRPGDPWEIYWSHGGFNVRSPLTPALTQVALVTSVALLLAGWGAFVVVARRRGPAAAGDTVAQAQPRLVAGFALLLLSFALIGNKVFSPQFVLWILPLVPLINFRPWPRRVFWAGTLALTYLTMRIFPYDYWTEVLGWVEDASGHRHPAGPTPFGVLLLFSRNLLCVALAAALGWALLRRARAPAPGGTAVPAADKSATAITSLEYSR
jgi:hypothetical protein